MYLSMYFLSDLVRRPRSCNCPDCLWFLFDNYNFRKWGLEMRFRDLLTDWISLPGDIFSICYSLETHQLLLRHCQAHSSSSTSGHVLFCLEFQRYAAKWEGWRRPGCGGEWAGVCWVPASAGLLSEDSLLALSLSVRAAEPFLHQRGSLRPTPGRWFWKKKVERSKQKLSSEEINQIKFLQK